MRFCKASGVHAAVLGDGRLEVRSHGYTYVWGQTQAAIWIAIVNENGDVAAAADLLARMWGEDGDTMRAEVADWTAQMYAAGLLQLVP